MKNVLLLVITFLLSSCVKTKCPPGTVYKCGSGCVATIENTPEVAIEPPKQEEVNRIPSSTKYRVSDKVCVLGKWTGVVTNVFFAKVPSGHEDVIAYTIEYLDLEDKIQTADYYDTQLERGECR